MLTGSGALKRISETMLFLSGIQELRCLPKWLVICGVCLGLGCSSSGTGNPAPEPEPGLALYFPPDAPETWETVSPAELGWNEDHIPILQQFLEESGTRGFIVLVGGKIALELYMNGHSANELWYWASAGKTLTALTVGIAQQDGLLSIDRPTSDYLGDGWTSASPEQEEEITVWHQLTMTTGLDSDVFECTTPDCLPYLVPAGTRWYYHNGPYTLLHAVVSAAAREDFDLYFNRKVRDPLGMNGFWFDSPEGNRVYYSNTRSMARFGLSILANARWENSPLLSDENYLEQMRSPSQELNPSYGYLWWLNGQLTFRMPGLEFEFEGPLVPAAPSDMYCGLGKNDQKLYVAPSLDMVVVRMGEDSGYGSLALSAYDQALWEALNGVLNR